MLIEDAKKQYETEPEFRMLVDVVYQILLTAKLTPSEVRSAATYACFRHELYHTRPSYIVTSLAALDEAKRKGE